MINVKTWPREDTRGPDDGRRFTARSKHGAPNELARQPVAAGVPGRDGE
jgi:hypothetical protein